LRSGSRKSSIDSFASIPLVAATPIALHPPARASASRSPDGLPKPTAASCGWFDRVRTVRFLRRRCRSAPLTKTLRQLERQASLIPTLVVKRDRQRAPIDLENCEAEERIERPRKKRRRLTGRAQVHLIEP